jgi:hypothetical protein
MISLLQRAEIRRLFYAEHWPIGTIADALGVHHETVRRALNRARIQPGPQIRPSELDPYKAVIATTLEQYPRLRATRLHAMLRERGYPGSAVQVRRYVRTVRPAARAEAFFRLDTLIGEQGQVDWGNFGAIQIGAARRTLSCFVLVLSWSRAVYARFALDQTLESFLRGHVEAFAALGGIPRVLLPEYVARHIFDDDGAGDAAEEGQGALMAAEPVGLLLGARRLGVGVVGGAEDGDEQLDRADLAGGGIGQPGLLTGVVDEAFVAGAVDLAHRQAPPLQPAAVDLAELGVTIAGRVLLQVLEVEQLQGDAGLSSLGVDPHTVRPGPSPLAGHLRPAVEPRLQGLVRQLVDLDPVQPGDLGPQGGGPHRPVADPEAARHLPVAPPQDPLLPQDFTGMSHGQSLGRHPLPLWEGGASDRPASLRGLHPPGGGCPTREVITMPDLGDHDADLGDHDRPILVITMDRSGCSRSSETRTLRPAANVVRCVSVKTLCAMSASSETSRGGAHRSALTRSSSLRIRASFQPFARRERP